jgi:hypothetical protein
VADRLLGPVLNWPPDLSSTASRYWMPNQSCDRHV